jgi:CRP-like cAMP-binding protein
METINSQKVFRAGEVIMRQGEFGECAYIIDSGQVEILIEKTNGLVQRVGTRGPGTVIGEMAIVDDEPRVATIKAVEDCRLLEITRSDFHRRLKSADPVIQMISQIILTRYRDMLVRASIFKEPGTFPRPKNWNGNSWAKPTRLKPSKLPMNSRPRWMRGSCH